jgi:hypothetical protein
VIQVEGDGGFTDDGIQPLAYFVDSAGPDAVALTLEANGRDEPYPALYMRRKGSVTEHLLPPHPLLDFESEPYARALSELLKVPLDPTSSIKKDSAGVS